MFNIDESRNPTGRSSPDLVHALGWRDLKFSGLVGAVLGLVMAVTLLLVTAPAMDVAHSTDWKDWNLQAEAAPADSAPGTFELAALVAAEPVREALP